MPDQEPYRATLKAGAAAEGRYLTYTVRVPNDAQADAPEGVFLPPKAVVTYSIPANVTEAEWQSYPAEVKQYVRDAGLHDVQTDAEARAARGPAPARAEPAPAPASQDATASLVGDPEKPTRAGARRGGQE